MKNILKVSLFIVFIFLTLLGVLFGASMGVDYSHIKMAFYFISLPLIFALIIFYLFRFKAQKPSFLHYGIAVLSLFYSTVVGGGYVYLVNSFGVHEKQVMSGPVVLKKQYKGYRKPGFYITFKDYSSEEVFEIELTSSKYYKLEVGDIYTETMYIGSLGLLYRRK